MRLIGEYFPETIFFYHSYWYDFKQIKGHTVLVIDFYKYGGSEKNRGGSERTVLNFHLGFYHFSEAKLQINKWYPMIIYIDQST